MIVELRGRTSLRFVVLDSRPDGMAQRIPIQLHVANALQWLGTLYRNPADALKEHVSNAIDEHLKAKLAKSEEAGKLQQAGKD